VIGRGDFATKWIAPAELSAIRLSVAFLILSGLAHSRYVVFGAHAYDAERASARASRPFPSRHLCFRPNSDRSREANCRFRAIEKEK
jgi:hypothetical protein